MSKSKQSLADFVNSVDVGESDATAADPSAMFEAPQQRAVPAHTKRASSPTGADDDDDLYDLSGATKDIGVALVGAVHSAYRAFRYGEKIGPISEESDEEREHAAESEALVQPVGGQGGNISDYITTWKGKNKFQATAAWYLREAHHDPLGADPCMFSMFLVAFVARMFYERWYEALVLAILLDFVETLSWVVIRMSSPILAKELDNCESRWIALVYNIFAFAAGITVASYVLHSWPGLLSVWEGLENKGCGSDGIFLLWAPCTDAQTFIVVALQFILIYLAAFKTLYVPSIALLVVVVAIAMLGNVEYDVFNNVLITTVSVIYFLLWLAAPIRGTYVWNMLLSVFFYLLVYSLAAISAA